MSIWPPPLAEHEERLTVSETLEQVRTACADSAADMGMISRDSGSSQLVFHDRCRPMTRSVQIMVQVSGSDGQVGVWLAGSTWGGRSAVQRDYVARVVRAFKRHVEREVASRPAVHTRGKRQRRRAILRCLTVVEWLPAGLLVPMVVVPGLLWGGERSKLWPFLVAYLALWMILPPVAESVRKRLVGTISRFDYVILGVFGGLLLCLIVMVVVAAALGRI